MIWTHDADLEGIGDVATLVRSHAVSDPVPPGATVGVVQQPGYRDSPGASRAGDALGHMGSQPTGGTRSGAAAVVPGLEGLCAGTQGLEGVGRVEQTVVGGGVEVLAPQLEAQVAGKDARPVAEAAWVVRRAGVGSGVQDGTGQLAVVGPGAPVPEVLTW